MPTGRQGEGESGRPRARAALFAIFPLLFSIASKAQQPRIQLSLDRNQVFEGDSILLKVELTGVSSAEIDASPLQKDFEVEDRGGGSNSSFQITFGGNGPAQRIENKSYAHQFVLSPRHSGVLGIGPLNITAEGRTLVSEALQVRVMAPEKQDAVLLELDAPRRDILPEESVTVSLRILVENTGAPFPKGDPLYPGSPPFLVIPWFDGMEGLKTDKSGDVLQRLLIQNNDAGYSINNLTLKNSSPFAFFEESRLARFRLPRGTAVRKDAAGNSRNYIEYRLDRVFTGDRLGSFTLEPAKLQGEFIRGLGADGRVTESRSVYVLSNRLTLKVGSLPGGAQPQGFTGAVGRFEISADIDPKEARVGDPLTLTLTVTGEGRLDRIAPLKLSEQEGLGRDFKVYDEASAGQDRGNSRVFTHSIRPKRAGTLTIPAIAFTYFDLAGRSYKTIYSRPLTVKIREAERVSASDVEGLAAPGSSEWTRVEGGLLPNAEGPGLLKNREARAAGFGPLSAVALLPPLLYFLLWAGLGLLRRRRADPRGARLRAAPGRAREALARARTALRMGQDEETLEALSRALGGLAADLALSGAGHLTAEEAPQALIRSGVEAAAAEELGRIMESCDEARYAPGRAAALAELLDRSESLVPRLSSRRRP